ncbi:MAG TPA: M56 family metallopeptidase, partial [Rhizomicrobium sp.]|nr:M56 family metallopeptidase [Rhizomicrobium sp.]
PEVMDAGPSTPVAVAAAHGRSMAVVLSFLLLVWFAGAVFCLARLGLGLFGLQRLCAGSVRFDGASDVRLADDGPLAFGCFQPLILLPHDAAQWPQSRLEAVLAHERAHLRRRDSLTQMQAQIVCALYWPNPLLWLGARAMRHQAEIAADNAVLAGGVRASDYAAELLQLAGQSLRLPAMAMAAPSLEARVKSVLSPEPSRSGVRAIDAFKIVWLGSAAAVALALVRPAITQADDVPPPPVPQAAAGSVLAALPVPPAPPPKPVHHHHHRSITIHGAKLAGADKASIDVAVAQAQTTTAAAHSNIQRAMRQARADRAAILAMQQAMPQVHAAIAQAMVQIPPQAFIDRQIEAQIPLAVHQAGDDARVDAKASAALERAETQINIAMNSRRVPHIAIRLWLFGPTTPPDPAGL